MQAGVNPNTMQRALAQMEEQGLLYTQRTAGRFVTEDVSVIRQARQRLAVQQAEQFLAAMHRLNFSKEEISALLEQVRGIRRISWQFWNAGGWQRALGASGRSTMWSLPCSPGGIVGLLGPNGSGKTTLIKLANGLLTPTSGQILIDGQAPGVESKKIVSYLPERSCLGDWMKVSDLLDFFSDFYADFRRDTAQEMLSRLSINPRQTFGHLSKGTREKVQLIMVMSRQAKLYLLDEPIGGVDPATRDYILHTIISNYNEDATVLISTHLIADVEQVLDEVIFLQNGRILLQSAVDDIRENQGKSIDALFREVFKC